MMLSASACRTIIERQLGMFKDYWTSQGVEWRYLIEEGESESLLLTPPSFVDPENHQYTVLLSFTILDGKRNPTTPFHRQSYVHKDLKIAKKAAWNRLLEQVVLAGIGDTYRTTVKLYRDGLIDNPKHKHVKHYPLTVADIKNAD